MDTVCFFFASVGLTYEQSAVKFVVRELKSGTALYKTDAHFKSAECYLRTFLSFNLQYLRCERRRVVKFEVSVFVLYNACTTE